MSCAAVLATGNHTFEASIDSASLKDYPFLSRKVVEARFPLFRGRRCLRLDIGAIDAESSRMDSDSIPLQFVDCCLQDAKYS